MPQLEQGDDAVEIRPFVEEALDALGYVNRDEADWLSEMIVQYANRNQGRSIREIGRRLSASQRAQLGISTEIEGHISQEVWDVLSEQGRRNPIANFDDTVARALRNARLALQKMRALRALSTGMFVGVQMGSPPAIGMCRVGQARVGKMFELPPELPFAGCDRPFCTCSWRLISRWEAEQITKHS